MREKFEPQFTPEEAEKKHKEALENDKEPRKKEKAKSEPSETAKMIIKEAHEISDEEVLSLSDEISEFYTPFIDMALGELKEKLTPEDFDDFNKAISKYPLVDLACGRPTRRRLLYILFKDKWKGGHYDYPSELKAEVDNMGIAEPPEYIGVDKYHHNKPVDPKSEELIDKVRFEKKDIIEYLRTLSDDSVNIFIGGFDLDISRPKMETKRGSRGEFKVTMQEDKYRAIMIAEIARVLAKGGYCLAAESPLYGEWKGQGVTPENFGLKEVPLSAKGVKIQLLKKPEGEDENAIENSEQDTEER